MPQNPLKPAWHLSPRKTSGEKVEFGFRVKTGYDILSGSMIDEELDEGELEDTEEIRETVGRRYRSARYKKKLGKIVHTDVND